MKPFTIRVALVVALAMSLLALPVLTGCSTSANTTPPAPVVAPVNTSPEPTEDPNVSQSPAEESESVHATGTP
jgi:hypothetical protein